MMKADISIVHDRKMWQKQFPKPVLPLKHHRESSCSSGLHICRHSRVVVAC